MLKRERQIKKAAPVLRDGIAVGLQREVQGDMVPIEMLGQGKTLDEATKALGQVAEGIYTVKAVKKLSEKLNVEMPISNTVYEILYGGMSLNEAVKSLLSRSPKPE